MAEDHIAHRKLFEHPGSNLAGESAEVVRAHVLRAEPDVRIENGLRNLAQRRERRTDDDVGLFDVGELKLETADEVEGLSHGLVHLPIAGENQFSSFHFTFAWPPRRGGGSS